MRDFLAQGFRPAWSETRLTSVGKYTKLDSNEFFTMLTIEASPSTGVIYGVEGVRFMDDSGIRNCMAELGRISDALKEKYPTLETIHSPGNSPDETFYTSRCEGKKRGIVSELCDGRGIGLMCGRLPNSTSESALERNKSSLSIRYFKSIEERQEYAAEVKALRDSLREQAMKNSGFDKDSL